MKKNQPPFRFETDRWKVVIWNGSFVGAPDWGLNWGLNRRFSIAHHIIIWIMLRKLAHTSHILLLWQDVYAWRKVNLLLTFIIPGFENGTRKKTKSLLRFEVAHKETSIDSNWNWPTSYRRSPCCIVPKHGWPKVNQHKGQKFEWSKMNLCQDCSRQVPSKSYGCRR